MKKRHYPKQKTVWYGVYHIFNMLSVPTRSLEFIVSSYSEAQQKIDEILKNHTYKKPKDYMIEEVDVTMHAWNPVYDV